jgi:hypothetical protein
MDCVHATTQKKVRISTAIDAAKLSIMLRKSLWHRGRHCHWFHLWDPLF